MVKAIYRKGKKYLIIEGREYGPISLYYHILRSISTFKSLKESGEIGKERLREIKHSIARLIKIYKDYYPEEASKKLRV